MKINTPYQLLDKWKRRLTWIGLVAGVILIGLLYTTYHYNLIHTVVAFISGGLGLLSIYYIHRQNQPTLNSALDLAHSQNDKIEFSGQLLLDKSEASGLKLLQKEKATALFGAVDYKLPWDYRTLRNLLLLIGGFTIGAITVQSLLTVQTHEDHNLSELESVIPIAVSNPETAIDTTFLQRLLITEVPPSYTGLPSRNHRNANIQIVEGASLNWQAKMNGPLSRFYFRFSAGDTIDVTRRLSYQKEFFDSDFYEYGFNSPSNDFASEFHGIKVIRDQKPTILITGIEEYVRLPWKPRHDISFDISITDDYGLDEAFISATIAKGSGESVKFREREFKLKNYSKGGSTYKGSYSFRTDELKMEPGDELYFYVKASDYYPYGEHWTKSVTHFISIADTTTYDYVEEGGMQIDLLPDFFRSQRQIIIESEQLIKDKPFIALDSFNRASNELGFDQKMLRLKYGQFLGEENESGIAINNDITELEEDDHDHDHDHDHAAEEGVSQALEGARDLLSQYMHDHDHEEEAGQLMATKGTESKEKSDPARPTWVEELSHNHDNTEEATFHDVSVKGKLRAALSAMWDAELHLRLYDPASSLKHQYESLELLQEIKNHARIYVHRIGFDPPTIKEGELRLDGDQDKIDNRLNISDIEIEDEYLALKQIAESLGSNDRGVISEHLESAVSSLAKIALRRPEVLPVLSLANTINLNLSDVSSDELALLRSKIIKVIPKEAASINGANRFAHELTLGVAKKMTN